MTDAEKNEMLNMLRSKISELYSTDTAEQLERDSAMLLEDHSSTEGIINVQCIRCYDFHFKFQSPAFCLMFSNAMFPCLICLDVVNSEVELPRSSSTPEKENETPDTAAEQQERDLVIPLEEHSLTEGNK